jgi:GT2 family glycosyltransferase
MTILRQNVADPGSSTKASSERSVTGQVRAVIVNYNTAGLTQACVQSLLAQSCADQIEIVVVDNQSDEGEWQALQQGLKEHPVTLFRCLRNLGYAGGINAGTRLQTEHTPDYILALNPDISFSHSDSVRQLVNALRKDPRRVACSPLIGDQDCSTSPEAVTQVRRVPDFRTVLVAHSFWLRRTGYGRRLTREYLYEDLRPFSLGTTIDCETINGACFLADRRFLEGIGFLDGRTFLYSEELTFGASIRARGCTACLCTCVVANHVQGASTGLKGHRRPLRRELQRVYSEFVYLRHYSDMSWPERGLFTLVRTVDIGLGILFRPITILLK